MTEVNNRRIVECLHQLQAGDQQAANALFAVCGQRLQELARRMLDGFPTVSRHTETSDVVQGASLRLLRALHALRPQSASEFFSLAALQIRRELLDLSRYFGARRLIDHPDDSAELPDDRPALDELDHWARFHAVVEKLPVEERETIGLLFYHGKTHAEAAVVLNVCEKTVQRWWQAACARLHQSLGSELPVI